MGIAVDCPKCGKHLRVASELAGRRGKCPQCQASLEIPGPPVSAGAVGSRRPLSEQELALSGDIAQAESECRSQAGGVDRPGDLAAHAAVLCRGDRRRCLRHVVAGDGSTGQRLPAAAFWAVQAAGAVVLLCLVKPLVEPQRRTVTGYPLDLANEPLLRGLIDRICSQIGSAPPRTVLVECSPRTAVSGRGGGQLTLGLPLLACLSVDQFAGLVAGEMALVRRGSGSA